MECQKSRFLLNQMLSLFSVINPAYIQGINIFDRIYLNFKDCKIEHLKIIRNEYQHTKKVN